MKEKRLIAMNRERTLELIAKATWITLGALMMVRGISTGDSLEFLYGVMAMLFGMEL